ncbi:MAG: aldolase [Myxococcales bacterium]|nr:MAG: aldolase [Myxococcales bacterium]
MRFSQLTDFPYSLKGIVAFGPQGVKILDEARFRKECAEPLIYAAVFSPQEEVRETARWILWEGAHELGVVSASIHDLYAARGRDEYNSVCVPAVNIRALTYDSARALFRAAKALDAGPFIFEIAKSEIGYTFQKPAEYTTAVLAAALAEGHQGPVFVQGDHFQVAQKNYAADPTKEVESVKTLIREALAAGFYNIDLDTSTLVDLSKSTVPEQQKLNYEVAAELTAFIRDHEPSGVTVSVGGEIGEVGGKNSTVEELEAYLDGYLAVLAKRRPNSIGISKISVQTGTSHGGVPLPDGSVAQVALDFGVLDVLGRVSRSKYKISGTVQHGASTLPDEAFNHFRHTQAVEVHLATGFQNLVYDHPKFPAELKERVYAWLQVNCAKERKPGKTEEQFLYSTRKKGFGPYKWETWTMEADAKAAIMAALEAKFRFLFDQLGLKDTRGLLAKHVKAPRIRRPAPEKFGALLANPNVFGAQHGAEEDAPGAD